MAKLQLRQEVWVQCLLAYCCPAKANHINRVSKQAVHSLMATSFMLTRSMRYACGRVKMSLGTVPVRRLLSISRSMRCGVAAALIAGMDPDRSLPIYSHDMSSRKFAKFKGFLAPYRSELSSIA